MKRRYLALAALSVISAVSMTQASMILNLDITHDAIPSPAPQPVSSTDLVNQGQPSYGGFTTVNFMPYTTASANVLNDGSSGAWSANAPDTAVTTQTSDWSIIYSLIGSPGGYNISEVDVMSLWSNDYVNQNYSIAVTTVANASFTTIVPDVLAMDNTAEYASSLKSLVTDSTGTLATGVTSIELTFHATPDTFQGNTVGPNQAAYREVDVFGSPTAVPEPGASIPAAVGLLGLLARRRKRITD